MVESLLSVQDIKTYSWTLVKVDARNNFEEISLRTICANVVNPALFA